MIRQGMERSAHEHLAAADQLERDLNEQPEYDTPENRREVVWLREAGNRMLVEVREARERYRRQR